MVHKIVNSHNVKTLILLKKKKKTFTENLLTKVLSRISHNSPCNHRKPYAPQKYQNAPQRHLRSVQ